jgi:hypothetical protein
MKENSGKWFWKIHFLGLALVSVLALVEIGNVAAAENIFETSRKWSLAAKAAPLIPGAFFILFVLSWTRVGARLDAGWNRLAQWFTSQKALSTILAIIVLGIFPVILFGTGSYRKFFDGFWVRGLLLWLLSILLSLFSGVWFSRASKLQLSAGAILFLGVIYRLAGYIPSFNNDPFAFGWSEGSWYYYASFFFARRIYGTQIEWPFLDFTHHLVQAVPFAFGDFPIIVHRGWQAFLWVAAPGLAAFLLV